LNTQTISARDATHPGAQNPKLDKATHTDADRFRGSAIRPPRPSLSFFRCRPRFSMESDRGVLLRSGRLRGVELPVTLLDSAGPLVPGKGSANMVGASALACSGDFLLHLASCQGKDLVSEVRQTALAASWFRDRGARAPT